MINKVKLITMLIVALLVSGSLADEALSRGKGGKVSESAATAGVAGSNANTKAAVPLYCETGAIITIGECQKDLIKKCVQEEYADKIKKAKKDDLDKYEKNCKVKVENSPELQACYQKTACGPFLLDVSSCMGEKDVLNDLELRSTCELKARQKFGFTDAYFDGFKVREDYKPDAGSGEPCDVDLDILDDFLDDEDTSYDVEPDKSAYSLKAGDLLAWGIPAVPRIPAPRMKSSSSSASSGDSSNAASQPVDDDAYKNLKMIEVTSTEITDTQKDAFLRELDAQAANSF
jgi:hypothetical protein